MNFVLTDTFTRSLEKLDGPEQKQVKISVFDFQQNPDQPGASFHRIDQARDANMWSLRVNRDIRIVVHHSSDDYIICYVDHHDDAYKWAENHELRNHRSTGALQLVEVEERVEEITRQIERLEEAPVFERFSRDYLAALGVPSRWLDAAMAVGESGLDALLEHLPPEAGERLTRLYVGEPVPIPAAAGTLGVAHPDAARRFRLLDSQAELRQALEFPWERWIVFLHPDQRAVVERDYNGPALVTGSAGTGKSVVAMHRAARLLRESSTNRVLLTSFSRTLAARLEQHMRHLMGADDPAWSRLDVVNVHRLAADLWSRHNGAFNPVASDDLDRHLARSAERQGITEFPVAFLRSEWDAVVDPWGVSCWDEYRDVPRVGRGTPLGARQRLALWSVFEDLNERLAEAGTLTWSRLCHNAADALDGGQVSDGGGGSAGSGSGGARGVSGSTAGTSGGARRGSGGGGRGTGSYDHVIADECQDLGPAELRLLRALAPDGANNLFLCGDAGQQIYRRGFSWLSTGIDVRGRSTRLRVNYRTTDQIRRFADGILPGSTRQPSGEEEARDSVSLLHGPDPDWYGGATAAEESEYLAAWIESLFADGFEPHHVAVFARTKGILDSRVVPALRKIGRSPHHLSDDAPPSESLISIGSMHRAKGLEFRAVAVVGCDAELLPLKAALRSAVDAGDRDEVMAQERHLLYVACTRAQQRLLVSWTGTPSAFVPAAT